MLKAATLLRREIVFQVWEECRYSFVFAVTRGLVHDFMAS